MTDRMLEQYPEEAWRTNVLGALHVLQAAEAAGVDTFINVSTDAGFMERLGKALGKV